MKENTKNESKQAKYTDRDLPGEQIGQYSANMDNDVKQQTRTMNSPSEESQKSRG